MKGSLMATGGAESPTETAEEGLPMAENDGSCTRLRPSYVNHVWSYDFIHHRTKDGRVFRTRNVLDEFS